VRLATYFLAFLTLLILYFAITFGIGFLIWTVAPLVVPHDPESWWFRNGVPVVVTVISASVGATVAVSIIALVFRSLIIMRLVWAFVLFLAAQWLLDGLWRLFGSGTASAPYLQGILTAAVAAITAIGQGLSRHKSVGL